MVWSLTTAKMFRHRSFVRSLASWRLWNEGFGIKWWGLGALPSATLLFKSLTKLVFDTSHNFAASSKLWEIWIWKWVFQGLENGLWKIKFKLTLMRPQSYGKVVSSNIMSCLEAHAGIFKLLMKRIFAPYVLWHFDKKLIS